MANSDDVYDDDEDNNVLILFLVILRRRGVVVIVHVKSIVNKNIKKQTIVVAYNEQWSRWET